MEDQLEIEYKNLLTEKEYQKLTKKFSIAQSQIKKQLNHYFDTPQFHLKNVSSALRLREKGEHFELTLKQPAAVGLLETNQTVERDQAQEFIHEGKIPKGNVLNKLVKLNVPIEEIEYFGSLATKRAEIEYKNGLLVFDHSLYLDSEDFELEYEVKNPETGKMVFLELLHSMDIPLRKTENKIQRFYRRKYSK